MGIYTFKLMVGYGLPLFFYGYLYIFNIKNLKSVQDKKKKSQCLIIKVKKIVSDFT